MRGQDWTGALFSCISSANQMAKGHPMRHLRWLADYALDRQAHTLWRFFTDWELHIPMARQLPTQQRRAKPDPCRIADHEATC